MKKIIFFVLISLLLVSSLFTIKNQVSNNIQNFYVSNLTWNTTYDSFVYSKKWDKLSFLYKLKNKWQLQYSWWCIFSVLDIYSWGIFVKSEKDFYFLGLVWFAKKDWKYLKKDISKCISYKKNKVNLDKKESMQNKKTNKTFKVRTDFTERWWVDFKLAISDIVSNLDNMIMLTWKNLDMLQSIWLQDKFWTVRKVKWNYYAFILKNNLKWKYLLMGVDKSWKLLTSNQMINVRHYKWNLVVSYINPNKVYPGGYVTVIWKWFKKVISIQFSNSFITRKTDFKILSDSMLVVKIPYSFLEWKYYLNFMTTDWIYTFNDMKIFVKNLDY